MTSAGTCENYLVDLIYLLRERGAEATERRLSSSNAFDEGREIAYREVLNLIKSQAKNFGLDLPSLGLANLDPMTDALEPPKRGWTT